MTYMDRTVVLCSFGIGVSIGAFAEKKRIYRRASRASMLRLAHIINAWPAQDKTVMVGLCGWTVSLWGRKP